MCLLPGMLERAPSEASDRARNFGRVLLGLVVALGLLSLLLVISYSIWSVVQGALFCLYAFFVVRPLADKSEGAQRLFYVENLFCFVIISILTGLLSVLNLVNLVTGKQSLFEKLKHWQVIVGIVLTSLSVTCYFATALMGYITFRELRTTVQRVPQDEEAEPFFAQRGQNDVAQNAFFSSFGYPPVGSYADKPPAKDGAQAGASSESTSGSNNSVFKGKGYRLNSD